MTQTEESPKEPVKHQEMGKRLQEARKDTGLEVRDIARILDIGEMTVYQWERGRRKPKPELLVRYAEVLGVTVAELEG